MKNDCTNPTTLPYTCKFCGRAGVACYDADCPTLNLKLWQEILACDRCAEYRTAVNRITDVTARIARSFSVMAQSSSSEVRTEAAKAARERFTKQTRDYAQRVCGYHNVTVVWEQDFVDMLMEKPELVLSIMRQYENGIYKLAPKRA